MEVCLEVSLKQFCLLFVTSSFESLISIFNTLITFAEQIVLLDRVLIE